MTYLPKPMRECDLVMKGGITSGVIYPRAVCELARSYSLRSVGGSSAGAIAAAGAAAAEFGRETGGFDLLWALPDAITENSPAGGSVLFQLFRPTARAKPLFDLFTAGMGQPAPSSTPPTGAAATGPVSKPSGVAALRLRVCVLLSTFRPQARIGAIPGIILIALGVLAVLAGVVGSLPLGGWILVGIAALSWVVGGAAVALLGATVSAAWAAVSRLAEVSTTEFGLCTGMPNNNPDAGQESAACAPSISEPATTVQTLTPFLHDQFQAMAGPKLEGKVLTFGDLETKNIELRMMTTNITRRQPMPMPWATQEYFFDPSKMRYLFPEDVVRAMEMNPPQAGPDGQALSPSEKRKQDLLRAQALPMLPWPAPDDVPVIVATRMSLSFPLLITAIPLYAVDYSLAANRDASNAGAQWLASHPTAEAADGAAQIPLKPTFGVNWFSDGGICANLPVHFFDSPLPARPTFAIDLENFPPDHAKSDDQADNCYLPIENNAGLLRPWTTLATSAETLPGLKALGSFISQIVDTDRGWLDAAQLVTPGYRDRVVTIYHDDAEGGMNLMMSPDTVSALATRGQAAATKLVDKFVGNPKGSAVGWGWTNQRWIRFRTATSGLAEWLTKFQAGYHQTDPGLPPALSYIQLAGPDATGTLPSYKLASAGRASINDQTAELLELAASWEHKTALSDNAPRPQPQLRLMPDDGAASVAENAPDAPNNELPPYV